MPEPNAVLSIGDFYRQAHALKRAVAEGRINIESLSDEGKTALAIASRQISVNDLSNEGRMAVGLEPLPEEPGMLTRLGRKFLDVTEAPGAAAVQFGQRTLRGIEESFRAPWETTGNVVRGGQAIRQGIEQLRRGQLGHAAAEFGGALGEAGQGAMNAMGPIMAPLVPFQTAGEMIGEAIPGGTTPIKIGLAEVTPAQGLGMAATVVGPWAAGRLRVPPLREPLPTIGRPIRDVQAVVSELINGARDATRALANEQLPEVRHNLKETRRMNLEAARRVRGGQIASFDELESFLWSERGTPLMERVYQQAPDSGETGATNPNIVNLRTTKRKLPPFGETSTRELAPEQLQQQPPKFGSPIVSEGGEFRPPVEELSGLESHRAAARAQRPVVESGAIPDFTPEEMIRRFDDNMSREARDAAWRNQTAEMIAAEQAASAFPGTQPVDLTPPVIESKTPGKKKTKRGKGQAAENVNTQAVVIEQVKTAALEQRVEELIASTEPGTFEARVRLTPEEQAVSLRLRDDMGFTEAEAQKIMETVAKNPEFATVVKSWLEPHERTNELGVVEKYNLTKADVMDKVQASVWGSPLKTAQEMYGQEGTTAVLRQASEAAGAEKGNYGIGITTPTRVVPKPEAMEPAKVLSMAELKDLGKTKGLVVEATFEVDPKTKSPTTKLSVKTPSGEVTREFKSLTEAYDYVSREGPGAASADELYTPGDVADVLIEPAPKFRSANLMPERYGKELGLLTGRWRIATPGMVFRTNPATHIMFSRAIELKNWTRRMAIRFKTRAMGLASEAGVTRNEQLADDLFAFNQIMYEGDPAKIREAKANVRPEIQALANQLRFSVFDPIKEIVQQARPGFKGIEWYLPHFPLQRAIADAFHRYEVVADLAKRYPHRTDYKAEAAQLKNLHDSLLAQDQTLKAERLRLIPGKGYFGPISESRRLNLPYETNFTAVMERYFEGLERVTFLDRFLPEAKEFLKSKSLEGYPLLVDYTTDWINSIRGAYGRRFSLAVEGMIKNFGVTDPIKIQHYADVASRVINYANTLQVLRAMGGRLKSAMVNSTQTWLTVMPEVGLNSWSHGVASIVTRKGWRLANAVGEAQFVPQSLAEISSTLDIIARRGSWADRIELLTEKGTRVSMAAFRAIELMNRVIAVNAGAHYARTHLGITNPVAAARWGAALSRRANYIYDVIDRPLAMASPEGRMLGLFQTFKINFTEQMVSNFQRGTKSGEWAPFVRQFGAMLSLGGASVIPLYAAFKEAMLKLGVDVEVEALERPIQWATHQMSLPQGGLQLEDSFSPYGPNFGVTGLAPFSLATNIASQGTRALAPLAIREMAEGAVEVAESSRGQAHRSFQTERPVSRRSTGAATARMFALTKSPESLQRDYIEKIRSAVEANNFGRVRMLAREARERGIILPPGIVSRLRRQSQEEGQVRGRLSRFIEATGLTRGD